MRGSSGIILLRERASIPGLMEVCMSGRWLLARRRAMASLPRWLRMRPIVASGRRGIGTGRVGSSLEMGRFSKGISKMALKMASVR